MMVKSRNFNLMIEWFLCVLGFHRWVYSEGKQLKNRGCARCCRYQGFNHDTKKWQWLEIPEEIC